MKSNAMKFAKVMNNKTRVQYLEYVYWSDEAMNIPLAVK
jgi:hypothetical protein